MTREKNVDYHHKVLKSAMPSCKKIKKIEFSTQH